MVGQGHALIAFAKIPEIKPLEAAPIRFAGCGSMRFQQTQGAAEVALVPGVLRQIHVGVVKILIGAFAILLSALRILVAMLMLSGFRLCVVHRLPPLPQGAAEAKREDQDQGGAETRQGRFAPAPTPGVLETR